VPVSLTQIKIATPLSLGIRRITYNIFYYSIVAVLLFSGISKIIDPIPTVETLKAAFKTSDELNLLIATALPILEMALAIMMILKYKLRITLITINVLFFFFLLFAVYGTLIGLNIDCGCFSNVVSSEFGMTMILRNLLLTTIASWLVFTYKKFASAGRKQINLTIKRVLVQREMEFRFS